MKQNELLNKRIEIVEEMEQEIERARKKHGNQNHLPSLHKDLLNRDALRMCEEYEIPSEARAKFLTDDSFKYKKLTHAHILIEELVEAISCMKDEKKMRKELIQVMAMTMNWIVSIDAKHKKS